MLETFTGAFDDMGNFHAKGDAKKGPAILTMYSYHEEIRKKEATIMVATHDAKDAELFITRQMLTKAFEENGNDDYAVVEVSILGHSFHLEVFKVRKGDDQMLYAVDFDQSSKLESLRGIMSDGDFSTLQIGRSRYVLVMTPHDA